MDFWSAFIEVLEIDALMFEQEHKRLKAVSKLPGEQRAAEMLKIHAERETAKSGEPIQVKPKRTFIKHPVEFEDVRESRKVNAVRETVLFDLSDEPLFSRKEPPAESATPDKIARVARHNFSVILRAMGGISQAEIAERMGVHPSTVSRLKSNGDLERACQILAACGFELPSEEKQLYDKTFVESLQVLVAAKLSRP